jgi:hypothetical protein
MRIFKILLTIVFTFWLFNHTSASNIELINTIDKNTIELNADLEVQFKSWNNDGQLKVLKDVKVSYSAKDLANNKKIILNLSNDFKVHTSYSLISVMWAEWDIDFTIWSSLVWEIVNPSISGNDIVWIKKINIIDKRTLELYYVQDLQEDIFEYKILSELGISSQLSSWDNKLILNINKDLENNTDYIVMIVSIEDTLWNNLDFGQWLYEFRTDGNVVEEEKIIPKKEEWNIPKVALESAETPDTWAATWVLIALTLLVNLLFFVKRKIIN